MAGHRQLTGKPRRRDKRKASFHTKVMTAPTSGQQLAHAFDYFRSVALHCPDQAVVMNEMATHLFTTAKALEDRYDL
jgi:hypothetical protein